MKKCFFLIILFGWLGTSLLPQERVEVTVTNILVPVRVMEGNRFVDNLTREDMELLEDGKPQKIQALYVVRKSNVERKEALQEYNPILSRNFYLLFQMIDYNPKLSDLIDYLFTQVLTSGDNLVIQTPLKSYALSKQAFASKPKEELAKEVKNFLRKDIQMASTEYKSLLTDLKRLVRGLAGSSPTLDVESDTDASITGLEFMLARYKELSQKMETQRFIDEKKMIRFAQALKRMGGHKSVFLIYQREFRPEIQPSILSNLQSAYQDQPNVLEDLQDLFQLSRRDTAANPELLKKVFADSALDFSLIFVNKEPDNISGIAMREQSEDVFRVFSQIAKATGGIVDTSQNPAAGFQHAVDTSEAYYLLFYSPENYKKDGQFKNITVKVKNQDYTVLHRLGYFAN
jgi:VWFA-related protein